MIPYCFFGQGTLSWWHDYVNSRRGDTYYGIPLFIAIYIYVCVLVHSVSRIELWIRVSCFSSCGSSRAINDEVIPLSLPSLGSSCHVYIHCRVTERRASRARADLLDAYPTSHKLMSWIYMYNRWFDSCRVLFQRRVSFSQCLKQSGFFSFFWK